jgi:hypothetical protein
MLGRVTTTTAPLSPSKPTRVARLASGLPDAVTAGFFLVLWWAPAALWPQALRTGLLMMLVEFVLLHASGILGTLALAPAQHGRRRLPPGVPLAAALFYLMFIAAWSWQFRAWWPLLTLAWLFAAKAWLLLQPLPDADKRARMQSDWALGVLAYLGGVMATVFLPVPRLGLDHRVVAEADLPGGGLWVEQPQTVVAFGAFYFGVMAIARLRDWRLPHAGR